MDEMFLATKTKWPHALIKPHLIPCYEDVGSQFEGTIDDQRQPEEKHQSRGTMTKDTVTVDDKS